MVLLVVLTAGSGSKTPLPTGPDWWLNDNQQAWRALQANRPADAVESATDPLLQAYARYQIDDFRGVLELDDLGDTADGLYLRGNAMVQLGLMRQAITSFEQALGLRADFSAARYNLALVRFYLEQQPDAGGGDDQNGESTEDNSDILGQGNNQSAMSAGSVDNESGDGNVGGLGAGIVKELGEYPTMRLTLPSSMRSYNRSSPVCSSRLMSRSRNS